MTQLEEHTPARTEHFRLWGARGLGYYLQAIRPNLGWSITARSELDYLIETLVNELYELRRRIDISTDPGLLGRSMGVVTADDVGRHSGLALRFAILKRDNYRCCICGRSAADHGVVLEVDHRIPRAKGGTDDPNNLWTLCFDCNRGKRDTDL